MSVLLALAFLVAVVWLLAKAEEKGALHTGGCPCCSRGRHEKRPQPQACPRSPNGLSA